MAAPGTVAEFLELVKKSGVAEEKRVDAYLQKLRAANAMPGEPAKLAGLLVREAGLLTHFQAEQLMQGKWRRFTIGKYKVLERLGSGGMGSVFLCEHKLMRRRVAVKVLPTAKASDPASLDRFYREARAVAALDHPNIVHAYDIDQDEQLHFLVMEYVDGASLQELVKKTGPLDIARACHYIRQSALGLEHAHEAGLVHRDIKPGNILVDRGGGVKLLDMGLARFFNDEDDVLTKKYDENVLGTADYLAPEQAIDSHSVDIRADIYGLGATFYFLLTGKPPFGEGTVAQKLLWHQTRNPRPLSDYRQDVSPALTAVLAKMMAKEPAQRYAVPGEVAEALAAFTQNPIAPPSDAEMPRLSIAATGESPETNASRSSSTAAPRALQGMGSSAHQLSVPPRSGPGSSVRPGSSVGSGSGMRPPSGARRSSSGAPPRPGATRPGSPQPAPPPPATSSQSAAELSAAFESLANDTEDPTAAADTAPVRQSQRNLARVKVDQREQRRLKLILAALGIPFVTVIVAGVVWWIFLRATPAPAPAGRPKLVVSRDPSRTRVYKSIQLALRQAQEGDVIELADETHEENLAVEVGTGKAPKDITLQAAADTQVRWLPAKKDEALPLIRLTRAAGFRLKGKNITLDGKGQVRDLISITLQSPGLTIDDVTLQGFNRSGVAIVNGAGDRDRPIRLRNLNVLGAAKSKWALYLDANPAVESVPLDDYIEVSGLRVQGLDVLQAVQKKDNTVVGGNLVLPGMKD
jgi:eukaryotic-like serine/threonine-protein kinase